MKAKNLFLATFALVGLAACNNEESGIPGVDGETQSIVLRFDGLANAGSRAIDGSETAGAVTLNDVKICFATAEGSILRIEDYKSGTDDWNALVSTGLVFHEMPASITQVNVVGNTTGASLKTTNVSTLEASVIQASTQQDFDNVIVYGKDIELAEGTSPDDEGHTSVKAAEVTVTPLVSRIEIGDIKCTDLGNQFNKITLKNIGLANFYSTVTVGGTAGNLVAIENLVAPGESTEGSEIEFGSDAYSWAWDAFAPDAVLTNTDAYNPKDGEGTAGKFVYHFVPEDGLRVKMYLQAINTNTGAADPNDALTAGFSTTFEPGKIYTLKLEFAEEDIKPWNPDDLTCIQVSVDVAEWEVIALTPVYE